MRIIRHSLLIRKTLVEIYDLVLRLLGLLKADSTQNRSFFAVLTRIFLMNLRRDPYPLTGLQLICKIRAALRSDKTDIILSAGHDIPARNERILREPSGLHNLCKETYLLTLVALRIV